MKIRSGFVSNSSSSSFVIVTTKETLKTVLNSFEPKQRKFLKDYFGNGRKIWLDGNEKVVFSGTIYTEELGYEQGYEGDDAYEVVESFIENFSKLTDSFSSQGD